MLIFVNCRSLVHQSFLEHLSFIAVEAVRSAKAADAAEVADVASAVGVFEYVISRHFLKPTRW